MANVISDAAPMISIITATYNAAREFAKTAESIRRQTYPHIQWIVIDGASTDSTLDEIRRNEDLIDYWVSEPDHGIYDAWNKGCARLLGEWVLFIGSGDELASPDVLERFVPSLVVAGGRHEIVYGRTQLVTPGGTAIAELGAPWGDLVGRWGGLLPLMPPHPSSFHHRSMFGDVRPFDSGFRYAGDSEFISRSVMRREPLFVPMTVDRMLTGGVTVRPSNYLGVARERRQIAKRLPQRAPLMHRVRWYVTTALQYMVLTLVPAVVRRGAIDEIRNLRARTGRAVLRSYGAVRSRK
jgi:glycosyltransferase involved in cell wall biosynthesis